MRRFRCTFLILVAFWLPIQAAYAATMPFCRHAAMQAAGDVAAQASIHCHEHEGVPSDAPQEIPASDGGVCDNCAMCHLATTGYLPVTSAVVPLRAASILVATPLGVAANHFPEPPQHPPRHLN